MNIIYFNKLTKTQENVKLIFNRYLNGQPCVYMQKNNEYHNDLTTNGNLYIPYTLPFRSDNQDLIQIALDNKLIENEIELSVNSGFIQIHYYKMTKEVKKKFALMELEQILNEQGFELKSLIGGYEIINSNVVYKFNSIEEFFANDFEKNQGYELIQKQNEIISDLELLNRIKEFLLEEY